MEKVVEERHYKGYDIHVIETGGVYIFDIYEGEDLVEWTLGGRITVEDASSGSQLSDELHILKALDFDEFAAASEACGFEVISFSDRANISERASDASWRFMAVIRKVVVS